MPRVVVAELTGGGDGVVLRLVEFVEREIAPDRQPERAVAGVVEGQVAVKNITYVLDGDVADVTGLVVDVEDGAVVGAVVVRVATFCRWAC